jgi:hypothetical protein
MDEPMYVLRFSRVVLIAIEQVILASIFTAHSGLAHVAPSSKRVLSFSPA